MPKVKYDDNTGLFQRTGAGMHVSSSVGMFVTGTAGFQNLGWLRPYSNRLSGSNAYDLSKDESGYIFLLESDAGATRDIDLPASAGVADGNDGALTGWNVVLFTTGGLDQTITVSCDDGSDTILSRSLGGDQGGTHDDNAGITCASNILTFSTDAVAGDAVEILCVKDDGTNVTFLVRSYAST